MPEYAEEESLKANNNVRLRLELTKTGNFINLKKHKN